MPAVETLRRVWVQQYMYVEGAVRWRDADSTPPSALMISSPYDTEAHYARKRSTSWIGYKVHLTETCEEQTPHLITHVETADAPAGDSDAVSPIHEALAAKDLLPSTQLVDMGYVEAKLLVQIRRDYDVDLYGQTRSDYHWQSQAGHGFDAGSFLIDWGKQQATCPEGKKSLSWTPAVDRGDNEVIKIKFSRVDCRPCPSRALCTTTKHLRRTITIRTQAAYEALQAARRRQETDEFQEQYRERAGVEGTISQAVRANGDEALALRRISQDASAARADRRRVECGSHQRLVSWGATGGNTNISLRTDDCVVRAGVEAFATSIECAGEPRKSKQLFSITIPCAHRPAEAGRLGHRRAPMSEATSAVQPVWWLAPRPCPVSP